MPPKDKNKKGAKQLQALAQLNALQATYKAACRRHGVPQHKPLAAQIETAIQEGKKIDKLSFTGPEHGPGAIRAALEVAAAYPHIKNLHSWGCSVGDQGLIAISQLLKSSIDRGYTGSKLRLVEVVSDGIGAAQEKWPETFMSHISGGLAVSGPGHAMPALALGQGETVTADTLRLQQSGLPHASARSLDETLSRMNRVSAPVTTLMYKAIDEAHEDEERQRREQVASGALACVPAGGFYNTTPSKASALKQAAAGGLGGALPLSAIHSMNASRATVRTAAGAASIVTRTEGAVQEEGEGAAAQQDGNAAGDQQRASIDGSMAGAAAAKGDGGGGDDVGSLSRVGTLAGTTGANSMVGARSGRTAFSGVTGARGLRTSFATSRATTAGGGIWGAGLAGAATGSLGSPAGLRGSVGVAGGLGLDLDSAGGTAALRIPLAAGTQGGQFLSQAPALPQCAPRPMTFGLEALQQLSLALRAQGHGLQILALDHNQLGDLGAQALAAGLARCGTLKHLSLADCGIGPVGAAALAATMPPHPDPLIAPLVPKYAHINLSRNPLGGEGVAALSEGLALAATLKVLNLSGVGLTSDDVAALESLASALAANTSIEQIDLDCNFFGDEGAAVFVPLLQSATHIRKFRITARGMTRAGGGGQVAAAMRAKYPKKVVKKKKK